MLLQPCSGHGDCLGASGTCRCFAGYQGDDCGTCADRYVRVGGLCVFLPGAMVTCSDGVRNGNEEGVDCGGPNCEACRGTLNADAHTTRVVLAAAIVGCIGGIATLFSVFFLVRFTNLCHCCCPVKRPAVAQSECTARVLEYMGETLGRA